MSVISAPVHCHGNTESAIDVFFFPEQWKYWYGDTKMPLW